MTDGAEEAPGRLGAVLRARGSDDLVALGPQGPWLATTLAQARTVLTHTGTFDFPTDVSRRVSTPATSATDGGRSPHSVTPPLDPDQVARGRAVFTAELDRALCAHARSGVAEVEAMDLLRHPVARATCAAVLSDSDRAVRDRVADLVLAWIDALAPVIGRDRPPSRWSRARRTERRSLADLCEALRGAGCDRPDHVATVLAAGVQVPIAAGAWLLVHVAEEGLGDGVSPTDVAWETLRLTPPTWITARITRSAVEIGGTLLDPGSVVLVSPLLLGRLEEHAPAGRSGLDRFDPSRWQDTKTRPGSWLPFGAGPHACPGRTLGLGLLTDLARRVGSLRVTLLEPSSTDQSRGIFPRPARVSLSPVQRVAS